MVEHRNTPTAGEVVAPDVAPRPDVAPEVAAPEVAAPEVAAPEAAPEIAPGVAPEENHHPHMSA